jgi:hypothetical protein
LTSAAIRLSLSTALTNTAAQALHASAGWERDVVFCINHYALLKPIPPTRSDAAP